jgi:pilus assembly protein CpaE
VNIVLIGHGEKDLEHLLRLGDNRVTPVLVSEFPRLMASGAEAPDVVVVDLRTVAQIPPVIPVLKRQYPQTAVVIVTARLDPTLILEAMRAGVNECITTPIAPRDLDAALTRVVTQQRPTSSADVFAFIGAKGGIGTTTLAVNVATTLTRSRKENVLLMDLHVTHGDAAVMLGAEPRFSIADALEHVHRSDEAFFRSLVTKTSSGVDLLASSDRVMAGSVDPRSVKALLDFAGRIYRYLVLDVPRADSIMLDSLDRATKLVLVANQELGTVRNVARLSTALRQRYGAARLSVVLSRYESTAPIAESDIERATGTTVRHRFPSEYRRAVEAVHQGQPLVLGNHSALASRISALTQDLVGLEADASQARERRGLFGLRRK